MRHRKARKITSRVSSVTNGFVQAIIPEAVPDDAMMAQVLAILEIDPERLTCTYCGDVAHHWDHLHPYVRNKRPSGYLNEPGNLVPACGPCNTSKSGKQWREWMFGPAKGSPLSRGIRDIERRAARVADMEAALSLKPHKLGDLVEPDLWEAYWERRRVIEALMFEAQVDAELIRDQITAKLSSP